MEGQTGNGRKSAPRFFFVYRGSRLRSSKEQEEKEEDEEGEFIISSAFYPLREVVVVKLSMDLPVAPALTSHRGEKAPTVVCLLSDFLSCGRAKEGASGSVPSSCQQTDH
jgi:hypothetical protein